MNKISMNVSGLLHDNVVADDILKVYRSINNFSIVSKEMVDLENDLMINSFSKDKFLFNSKFLYYKLSIVLKDMVICLNKEQLETYFNNLIFKSKICMDYNIDSFSKIKMINKVCLDEFYVDYIDQVVTDNDILNVHKGISLDNQAFSEIILLEKRFLASGIRNSQLISSNKLVYYKLARQIKELGLKVNNQHQAEDIFNKLFTYTNYILSIQDIEVYNKLNLLDFLYFKMIELRFDNNKNLNQQFNNLNNEIKNLIKMIPKNVEEKKDKKEFVYSMEPSICPV